MRAGTFDPTIITGQNGKQIKQTTKVAVTGCKAATKPLTRAQKLAKALKQCRKKNKKKRAACETEARKKYGPLKRAEKSSKNVKRKGGPIDGDLC